MELTIKSLKGSRVLNVDGNSTVADVKDLLHKQHQDWPVTQQQRLVYKQRQLTNETVLEQAGVSSSDPLVLLEARPLQKPQAPRITPSPDAAAIRAAITEEARRRGIEHTLKEERHPAAQQRRNMALPRQLLSSLGGVDDQLVQLLEQALDGQFNLASLRLGGGGDQHTGEQEEGEEQDIHPPEPQAAHVAQLTDMGFTEALARKALILTRDNVQVAVEWLFEHGEDPHAADPPTQEQLRQVYGRRRGRRRQGAAAVRSATGSAAGTPTAAADGQGSNTAGGAAASSAAAAGPPRVSMEVVLSQLTDMGFDASAAQQALARVGPNLDLAVGMLLGQGLSAAIAMERGGTSGPGSSTGLQQDGSAGGSSAAAEGPNARDAAAAAAGGGDAADDDAAFESAEDDVDSQHDGQAEEDQELEYEDEEEDEYVDYDDNDDHGHFPLQALAGTMGSMDLNELGSADMEQLLQGAAIQDLYGSQLLMSGGIEGGMGGGPQGSLLRLMEAPVLLQQMVTALQEPQQQQQQQQGHDQPQSGQQQQGGGSGSGREQPGQGP